MAGPSADKLGIVIFAELHEVLDPEPHPGAWNMALDEILLQRATAPTLRLYRWSGPTVSLGYFEHWAPARELYSAQALVRRWTGGGIVEHGEDFTYTLLVPRSDAFAQLPAGETYRLIHQAVANVLAGGGEVRLAPAAHPKISSGCFENPAQYDLLLGADKIAGAAQRRTRHGLLHQGSVQVPGLGADFAARLREELAREIHSTVLSEELERAAASLAATKYGTSGWLQKF